MINAAWRHGEHIPRDFKMSRANGTHTANINVTGQYTAENFHVAADAGSGTLVSYVLTGTTPPEQQH